MTSTNLEISMILRRHHARTVGLRFAILVAGTTCFIVLASCRYADPRSPFESGQRHVNEASVGPRTEIQLKEVNFIAGPAGRLDFALPPIVAVDPEETLYVLDMESLQIVVVETTGRERARFAGRGLGLGRVGNPGGLAIAGDHVVVSSYDSALLRIWSKDGEFVGEVLPEERASTIGIVGYDESSLIRTYRMPGARERLAVARLWLDGREEQLFTVPLPEFPMGEILGRPVMLEELSQFPRLARGQTGPTYLNAGVGYRVAAFDPEVNRNWVTETDSSPLPYASERASSFLDQVREIDEKYRVRFSEPEHFPVLSAIRADGLGRLYVFPFVRTERYKFPAEFPVDVYSPDGRLLVRGTLGIGGRSWAASAGDVVFGIQRTPESGKYQVFRARIVISKQ